MNNTPDTQAALRKVLTYMKHGPLCAVIGGYDTGCTCGRDAAANNLLAALSAPMDAAQPTESFCFCNDDISLQIVSGGAAPEGLYGRIVVKIGGEYVDYVKASTAPAPVAVDEREALLNVAANRAAALAVYHNVEAHICREIAEAVRMTGTNPIDDDAVISAPAQQVEAAQVEIDALSAQNIRFSEEIERLTAELEAAQAPVSMPSDAEIIAAVKKACGTGRVALTWTNNDGIEKPTDVAKCFARALLQCATERIAQGISEARREASTLEDIQYRGGMERACELIEERMKGSEG